MLSPQFSLKSINVEYSVPVFKKDDLITPSNSLYSGLNVIIATSAITPLPSSNKDYTHPLMPVPLTNIVLNATLSTYLPMLTECAAYYDRKANAIEAGIPFNEEYDAEGKAIEKLPTLTRQFKKFSLCAIFKYIYEIIGTHYLDPYYSHRLRKDVIKSLKRKLLRYDNSVPFSKIFKTAILCNITYNLSNYTTDMLWLAYKAFKKYYFSHPPTNFASSATISMNMRTRRIQMTKTVAICTRYFVYYAIKTGSNAIGFSIGTMILPWKGILPNVLGLYSEILVSAFVGDMLQVTNVWSDENNREEEEEEER